MVKKLALVGGALFALLGTLTSPAFGDKVVRIKIVNPNDENNCKNRWCSVRVLIPARTYMEKGWLRKDLSNLEFIDPNYSFDAYKQVDDSLGNGKICRPETQADDLAWWVDAVKNGNFQTDRLPVWLLVYNLQPGEERIINMVIKEGLSEDQKLYANPRALTDFRSDSGWTPDGDCNDAGEDNRHPPAKPGTSEWVVEGNTVFEFFAHGFWDNFIGWGWRESDTCSFWDFTCWLSKIPWLGSGSNYQEYHRPNYGIDDDGTGYFGNPGFCDLNKEYAHCYKNLKIMSDVKFNLDKYRPVNTGENALFTAPFTLTMKLYFKSTDVIKDWNEAYADYYEHDKTETPFINIYFLTQLEGTSNYWGDGCSGDWHAQDGWRCSPNAEDLDDFPGYKLVVYKPSDWDDYTDDSHFHRYRLKFYLYYRARKPSFWPPSGWEKIGEFDYPLKEDDVTDKTGWFLYDATKHVLDVKVGSDKIYVFLNGLKIGEVNRRDSWTKGAIGFDRAIWVTADWHDVDDVIVRSFFEEEPKAEVYGNVDFEVAPAEDGSCPDSGYEGADVIEVAPDLQHLEAAVDGSSLDKYVFSVYNIARESQSRNFCIKIKNRGEATDTYDLNLQVDSKPSDQDWIYYWCDGDGSNCVPGIPDSITLPAHGEVKKVIKVVPSPGALFQGGSIDLKLEATSQSDLSSDAARFSVKVYPLLGCYWKYRIPINLSYTNLLGDPAYSSLKDYQVLVKISGVDFSEANDDGSDIVVTDFKGAKIPFWIKDFDKEGGKLTLWVKVPEIESGNPDSNKVYVWFGNSNMVYSYSDRKRTFDLWEDWKDYSVDLSRIQSNSVGCPDGTEDCNQGSLETPLWKNITSEGQEFNWWFVYDRLLAVSKDGYSRGELPFGKPLLVCDIYQLVPPPGETYPYERDWPCRAPYKVNYKTGWHTCEWGPILRGGRAAWDHYEVTYLTLVRDTQYLGDPVPNPLFNPAFMIDTGNLWGMELFRPVRDYSKFTFRPVSMGIDWVWQKSSRLPFNLEKNTWYWVKVRVYKYEDADGQLKGHVEIFLKEAGSNLEDAEKVDYDTDEGFVKVASFDVPATFVLPRGSIGFSGWDGGWAVDLVRVRKFIEGEPSPSQQEVEDQSPREKISLSQPQVTPPLFDGRAAYVVTETKPFSWLGDLKAFYADCYISGVCEEGEEQDKLGTISIFGKISDEVPKGLGYYLMKALPGENNRGEVEDPDWLRNGRMIFTRFSDREDHDYRGFDDFDLSNCLLLKDELGTKGYCVADDGIDDETEKLIKFVRGFFVPDFPRSIGRSMDRFEGYGNQDGNNADDEQWKLGDILHSNPLIVGIPNMLYDDATYWAFVNSHRDRPLVFYFMSNDGMVHAFEVARFENAGLVPRYKPLETPIELWAYVPEAVLPRLKELTGPDHQYTADGLLRAIDVKDADGHWRTVLLGSGGRGGNYAFAVDVTDPSSPQLLWEINEKTHPEVVEKIGAAISAPALGKLGDRWVAIYGSGYSKDFIKNYTDKRAYLTVVDILSGEVLKQIEVGDRIGNVLTDITVKRDYKGNIEKVYFGDYYGAIWGVTAQRLQDLIEGSGEAFLDARDMLFKPYDYYEVSNPTSVKRPITARPVIARDGENNWWVYVGTGDYDEYDPDYPHQRFYGIKDLGFTQTDAECTPEDEVCGDLRNMTNSTRANDGLSWVILLGYPDPNDKALDNSTSQKDNNERVLKRATVFGGFVFFTTYQPLNEPCGGGISRFYAVEYNTGEIGSQLFSDEVVGGSGTSYVTARSVELQGRGVPSQPMIYTGHAGKQQVVATGLVNTSTGELEKINLNPAVFVKNINILLWRRVQ